MKIRDFIDWYSSHQPNLITCLYWNEADLDEELLPSTSVVFDFGANEGQEIEYFKDHVKSIHSFEPHPMFFEQLDEKYREQDNVYVYDMAVSDSNDTDTLYFKRGKQAKNGGATLVRDKGNISVDLNVEVNKVDVVELFNLVKSKVDIIKMDIEGGEYQVIERLIESGMHMAVGVIVFEDHERKINSTHWKKHKRKVLKLIEDSSMNIL